MPLHIVRNDITKMKVDAIVNAANPSLLGGGGVDGAIHRAAGPALLAECRALGGCETGSAKLTGAGDLPCRYVIHAVGPVWAGGGQGEDALLASCYRAALELARTHDCETVAFPLISSGLYGYPKDQALRVAVDAISGFVLAHDITVYLVVFDKKAFQISGKLFSDIAACIDDSYAEAHSQDLAERRRLFNAPHPAPQKGSGRPKGLFRRPRREESPSFREEEAPAWHRAEADFSCGQLPCSSDALSLQEAIDRIDESFSEMLLRKIDESGMTDAACYKKANIDRKLFSKIRSDRLYKPSKPTAIAFAIALELSLEETKDLLMKAGFALSPSSKFDIIIRYFIERKNYNIFEINEALFAFDQSLLGA